MITTIIIQNNSNNTTTTYNDNTDNNTKNNTKNDNDNDKNNDYNYSNDNDDNINNSSDKIVMIMTEYHSIYTTHRVFSGLYRITTIDMPYWPTKSRISLNVSDHVPKYICSR